MGLLDKEDENSTPSSGPEGIKILPANPIWLKIVELCALVFFLAVVILLVIAFKEKLFSGMKGILKIIKKYQSYVQKYCFYSIGISVFITVFIYFFRLKKPKFDDWIVDLAYKHMSSKYIWYKKKKLFIDFDRNLNKKNVMEFIRELCDKSDHYTYYFNEIIIDQGIASLTVTKKQEIPTKSSLDLSKDTAWNIIPLGDAVNHKLKNVSPVCWWLNDNNKRKDVIETTPSTSILISGGTGSGKSVLQQCIVGHISRFPDNFMMVGCDVKMVEFNDFVGVSSIKSIALNLEEVNDAVQQARNLMYERFNFMKENHVNNVYKVKAEVDYYEINGKSYQFDEIFSCLVDGERQLLKIEDIYKAVDQGKDVEIDESYCKM